MCVCVPKNPILVEGPKKMFLISFCKYTSIYIFIQVITLGLSHLSYLSTYLFFYLHGI